MSIINQFEHHQVKPGSFEQKLQELIVDIAQAVQNKRDLDDMMIHRINSVFEAYQSIQLRVGLVSDKDMSSVDDADLERTQAVPQQILLYTEFIDETQQLRRIYIEALISLLEAMEKNSLDLQRCVQCNDWFIPYQRAQVTKFCSTKCRNRYNYVRNKKQKAE